MKLSVLISERILPGFTANPLNARDVSQITKDANNSMAQQQVADEQELERPDFRS
jgi:hypothetical protein